MKILVVYYSHSGNNKLLALHLHDRLTCAVEEIVELKERTGFTILLDVLFNRSTRIQHSEVMLTGYQLIVFVGPVWAGRIATPLKAYMLAHKEQIKDYAFLTVCGGQPGQRMKLHNQLSGIMGQEPFQVVELTVNDLLPWEQRNKIKYVTPYRLRKQDLHTFDLKIRRFIDALERESVK